MSRFERGSVRSSTRLRTSKPEAEVHVMSRTARAKMLAVGPPLVFSTLLVTTVGPVLPALAGLAVFVFGLGGAVLAATRSGERLWLRVVCRARPLTVQGHQVAEVVNLLCAVGVGPPVVDLYTRPDGGLFTRSVGSRSVILTCGLVDAVRLEVVPPTEGAAVICVAVGRLRVGSSRGDLVIEWWTLPWQLLAGFVTGFARAFARLPLIKLGWRFRWVMGGMAIFQSLTTRKPAGLAAGVGVGLVLAATYAVQRWRRAWEHHLAVVVDEFVVDHGFGPVLAWHLRRTTPAGAPWLAERVDRLINEAQPAASYPPLRVVGSSR